MFHNLKSDLYRHWGESFSFTQKFEKLIFTPGIWATVIYRSGNWVQLHVVSMISRKLLMMPIRIFQMIFCFPFGIDISFNTEIGKGFYISHFGCIVVNGAVKIGDNCNISQGVTIGEGGRGEARGAPVIGNRVYIGPGAKIFGRIKVGDDVAIGANAVVTKDIPPYAVVAGIPASILNYKSSDDFIQKTN